LNDQHRHFNSRLLHIMQRFEGAYQHYHPAHTSMTAPEDYRNKPLATKLATLNLGTTKGKTSHPASTLPLRPNDSTAKDCGRIETWMKEKPRKHDTTEAELDGRYKTSLNEYCGDINDIRSAMSAICTRYVNGDVTAAGFALVANFALHLVELRTDEHDLMSRFGVSPAPALTAVATTHLSELRLSRLALFMVTHLDKLSIASAIQPQFNPSILPAYALFTHRDT
jgi:hypothetical protein